MVNVKHNQIVQKGQLLFTIDNKDYLLNVKSAKANLENVKQQISEQDASIVAAIANLKNAKDKYTYIQAKYQRIKNLKQNGFVSSNDYDEIQTDLNISLGKIATSKATLQQAIAHRGNTDSNNAQLLAAQALLEKAELNLSRTKIYAPVSGKIATVNLNVGDYVQAGKAVLAVVDSSSTWVEGAFPETIINRIHVGDKVVVYLMANTAIAYQGYIQSIGSAINSKELPDPGLIPQLPQVFNWVRLAENIPVNIQLNKPVNPNIFIPGISATVEVLD